jgi:hypothetical protein
MAATGPYPCESCLVAGQRRTLRGRPYHAVRQHASTTPHRSGGLAVVSEGGAMDGGAVASVPPPKPPF